MQKGSEWLQRWVPKYAWIPMAAWFTLNCLAFWGARWITPEDAYRNLALPIDHRLPMVPAFIVIYVLAFVSWFVGYALICREGPEGVGILLAEMLAKVICFAIFIILPTKMDKPPVEGHDIFSWMCRVVFSFDEPNVLFPSIHCLENWMIWRGMFSCRHISRAVKGGFFVYALLVFASTLLIKQHVIVDIPAAIVVGEIALWAGKKLRLGQRYAAWLHAREVTA